VATGIQKAFVVGVFSWVEDVVAFCAGAEGGHCVLWREANSVDSLDFKVMVVRVRGWVGV